MPSTATSERWGLGWNRPSKSARDTIRVQTRNGRGNTGGDEGLRPIHQTEIRGRLPRRFLDKRESPRTPFPPNRPCHTVGAKISFRGRVPHPRVRMSS
eukprot:scaffold47_cov334-Pavlova_lutheri.AAC.50